MFANKPRTPVRYPQTSRLAHRPIVTFQLQMAEQLRKGKSSEASSRHWGKLISKVNGGGSGGCPLLMIGMGLECYDRPLRTVARIRRIIWTIVLIAVHFITPLSPAFDPLSGE